MTGNEKTSPAETHVHHLFGFALGMVAGANAARRAATGAAPTFHDLPQGYAFGGTKLDTLAGDALLESNSQWFLLELKRSFASLRDELDKPRVSALRSTAIASWNDAHWGPLLRKASSAHQFLYLCQASGARVPELATLGYLQWLILSDDARGTRAYWQEQSSPFATFLLRTGRQVQGFSADELAAYVALMNHTESGTGLTPEDAAARIAMAVDEAGMATMMTYETLLRHLAQHREQSVEVEPPERG